MKRSLLSLLAVFSSSTAVNANVDPEVHKLCLPAADYLGYLKAMTTKSTRVLLALLLALLLSLFKNLFLLRIHIPRNAF